MVLFCLSEEFCQRRNVEAKASTGKPRLDFLKQPTVTVRIAKRGERTIAGVFGRRANGAAARGARLELSSGHGGMKHFAHRGTFGDEILPRSLDVRYDEIKVLS
jgi:hypothetical protein